MAENVPLSDRLAAALSKLAAGDGDDFTALVNGPDGAAVLAQDVKSDHFLVTSLQAQKNNLLLVLYLLTLTSANPAPALEAMRLVLSKPGGLALATDPVMFEAYPTYSLLCALLPDTYDQLASMASLMPGGLTQSPVPGLEAMLAAGADPNMRLAETANTPMQHSSLGDTLLMCLAHYAATLGEAGFGGSYGTVRGYVTEAAKVLVKAGADTAVVSTAAAYPDHAGKTMAEFAPDWFKAALSV